MKKFIEGETNLNKADKSVFVQCECGCGILGIEKIDEEYYDLRYYSTRNLAKKDRHAYDVLMTNEQFEEFLNALTELKCAK